MAKPEDLRGVDYFLAGSELTLLGEEPIMQDSYKVVHLLEDPQHHKFAAIIYLPAENPADHTFAVLQENTARKALLKTKLSPYILHPLRQSDDGLLIPWPHGGELVTDLITRHYTAVASTYYNFRETLLSLYTQNSPLPDGAMLSVSNLILTAETQTGYSFISAQIGSRPTIDVYKSRIDKMTRDMRPLISRS